MLDWCKKTLGRYKRGLVTGGAVTTGIVAMGYACKQKLLSWQQEHMELLLRNSHTEQHYLQHYQNMNSTLIGLAKFQDWEEFKINNYCIYLRV